ncbi:MAG: hypothetical protein GC190_20975 [Alphaproteobacteria bacterium]|nr:hypothetical protein [Alphaproteobacteria bacterium]
MQRILQVLFAAILTSGIAACALLQQTGTDDEAMRAAKVALTAYADFVQPAIITYGQLPTCGAEAQKPLCKDAGAWAQLKAADAAATSSIVAAQGVLDGESADSGQIAQAIADINAAQAAFKQAKGP